MLAILDLEIDQFWLLKTKKLKFWPILAILDLEIDQFWQLKTKKLKFWLVKTKKTKILTNFDHFWPGNW